MPAAEILDVFSRRLRAVRAEQGLSQEALAHAAGLDRTYVSGVERGERNLGLRNAALLANTLAVPLSELVEDRSPAPRGRTSHEYLVDEHFRIDVGFTVTITSVLDSIRRTNAVLDGLPQTLYTTVDLKAQSGIVGAVFAAEIASSTGAIVNPIEKGHPDVVPAAAATASEVALRNYPEGLELKATLGTIPTGVLRPAGEQRVDVLTGVTWQAHHQEVTELMALVWDYVDGVAGGLRKPIVTGVFYSDGLEPEDWGAVSGTSGRNTKVSGIKVSGKEKLGDGAVAMINRRDYTEAYRRRVGGRGVSQLVVAAI